MLDFCGQHGIVSDIELITADYVNEAYDRVLSSDVKYRFVIDIASIRSTQDSQKAAHNSPAREVAVVGDAESPSKQLQLFTNQKGCGGSPSKRIGEGASLYDRMGSFTIPTEEDELRQVFVTFDEDGSGFIDRNEFAAAMAEFEAGLGLEVSRKDLLKQFARYDTNSDGKMSFEEFSVFMLARASQ